MTWYNFNQNYNGENNMEEKMPKLVYDWKRTMTPNRKERFFNTWMVWKPLGCFWHIWTHPKQHHQEKKGWSPTSWETKVSTHTPHRLWKRTALSGMNIAHIWPSHSHSDSQMTSTLSLTSTYPGVSQNYITHPLLPDAYDPTKTIM